MKAGLRVIRGPDWQSKKQDGGEGHTGTIVYIPKHGSSDEHVTVIWDNGRELRYRAGKDGKYDLRVLDNAPTGIVHVGIVCDSCHEDPVVGIRWKCAICEDYDLCSTCYHSSKHEIAHGFMRIDIQNTQAVAVSPRSFAKSLEVKGVFKGAKVMRGPHWKWKNDDGGSSEPGEVKEIVTWSNTGRRGGVTVKWKATKKEGTYRLGGEGFVDVIYEEDAPGGKYFFEHLPLVDTVHPGEVALKTSDKVRVSLDKAAFKRLQEHNAYGGWNDGMNQCIDEIGTVMRLLYEEGKAVRVQYTDGKTWTVNRQALYRIHSFTPGEAVRILEDVNNVQDLQEGHGGWNDEMSKTLGKIGRIAKIDSDGDMRVKVAGKMWIYSPVCCLPLEDPKLAGTVPDLSKSELELGESDDLKLMQRDMQRMAGVLADLFVGLLKAVPDDQGGDMALVEAAAKGNLTRVKELVQKQPGQVNATHESKTALQLASYEGKVGVVRFLLANKADVNIKDNEGDTALHYSAFGAEEGTMDLLLSNGAKPDAQNKKLQTSLHITVGKGSVPCTKLLLAKGASVNLVDSDGDSPMHDCITQRKKQSQLLMAVFKSPNPDFSVTNNKGFNVLQWAALKDCKYAVQVILDKQPQIVNAQMKEGFTALHICAANDHCEIGSSLLDKAKANPNSKDGNGRTALHVAVSQSHKRMVELLLSYGCKVDEQDDEGNTALHVSQINRALPDELARLLGIPLVNDDSGIQISCMLIEAGAKVDIKNKKDKTPLDLCNDTATREFLKRLAGSAKSKTLQTSVKGVMLPSHWETMTREMPMIRITLDNSNGLLQKEFLEVRNKFRKTMPQSQIIKIERVQNKFLWEHYYFKRSQMESNYGKGCANEMDLYHGTKSSLVEVICDQNFDPRLAGDNVGTLFGQGAYFASESKYSDGYAEPDTRKHKFMFQCRVLAGKWTYGDPKYRRPPQMHDSQKLYDCCVDNPDRPKIFCLFDINQYYPEYVIEYK